MPNGLAPKKRKKRDPECDPKGFRRAFNRRGLVQDLVHKEYPNLQMHSGGGGCDGSWDLGFFRKRQKKSDQRSLELEGRPGAGRGNGLVRAKIVENYRNILKRGKYEPSRELIYPWSHDVGSKTTKLPKEITAAADEMMRGPPSERKGRGRNGLAPRKKR